MHEHGRGEPHVTETFGAKFANVDVVILVFRMRLSRNEATDSERQHLLQVVERWVDRFCRRRGLVWNGMRAGTVGGRAGEQPDAFAVAFTVAHLPVDWWCFSRMVWETLEQAPAMPMILVPGGIFEHDPGEQTDAAETEVGGETVTIGSQKHREH